MTSTACEYSVSRSLISNNDFRSCFYCANARAKRGRNPLACMMKQRRPDYT
jgi:hypothetical protein